MKKTLLTALLALMSASVIATGTIDSDFGTGSDEFEFERFSNEAVLSLIEEDMEMACNSSGLCTLTAVTSNDRRFTSTISFGEGSPASNLGNSSNGGPVIITDSGSNNGGLFDNQEYWGITLQYSVGSCTQSIKVPRSLYTAMNRYMYGLMDENGETLDGLDPAKEAMIMFYTTISKQASGCTALNQ